MSSLALALALANQARPDQNMEMKVKYIRDDRKEFDKNSSNFPFKSYIGFYSTGRCTKLLWNISVDNEYYNST